VSEQPNRISYRDDEQGFTLEATFTDAAAEGMMTVLGGLLKPIEKVRRRRVPHAERVPVGPAGRTLREMRLAKGATITQIADLMGVNQGSLSRAERGVDRCSEAFIARYLRALEAL